MTCAACLPLALLGISSASTGCHGHAVPGERTSAECAHWLDTHPADREDAGL